MSHDWGYKLSIGDTSSPGPKVLTAPPPYHFRIIFRIFQKKSFLADNFSAGSFLESKISQSTSNSLVAFYGIFHLRGGRAGLLRIFKQLPTLLAQW